MKTDLPMKTALRTGQSLHFHGEHGMTILTTGGTVVVSAAPSWLGEQVVIGITVLRDGDVHLLPSGGWIVITAQTDAKVVCILADAASTGTTGFVKSLAARIRRRWQSLANRFGRRLADQH